MEAANFRPMKSSTIAPMTSRTSVPSKLIVVASSRWTRTAYEKYRTHWYKHEVFTIDLVRCQDLTVEATTGAFLM